MPTLPLSAPLGLLLFALLFTRPGWAVRVAQARPQPLISQPARQPAADRVDVNRATLEELLRVPGMKPSWAGRIVRFRPYRTKLDLLTYGILPPSTYDRLKDFLIAHRPAPVVAEAQARKRK